MFNYLKDWRDKRIIRKSLISDAQWNTAISCLPLLSRLSVAEISALRELATLFLHRKAVEGAGEVQINTHMALIIALQACLPILKLGLDWYDGWVSVIVYPRHFTPERTVTDDAGVAHNTRDSLSGESWQRGPVILSWADTEHAGKIDGQNLVIHEFAHKLDMVNGSANGFPPLHHGMLGSEWTKAFTDAYNDFFQRWQHGMTLPFDGYAVESPAEFFAVLSEVFFETPENIALIYPDVYQQLKLFYKQDPLLDFRARNNLT